MSRPIKSFIKTACKTSIGPGLVFDCDSNLPNSKIEIQLLVLKLKEKKIELVSWKSKNTIRHSLFEGKHHQNSFKIKVSFDQNDPIWPNWTELNRYRPVLTKINRRFCQYKNDKCSFWPKSTFWDASYWYLQYINYWRP